MAARTSNATGAPVFGRVNAVVLMVAALVAAAASLQLLNAELTHLSHPDAELACDINPLIGCGTSLMSPQAHLLGVPNSVIGFAVFVVLAVLAIIEMIGRLPALVWIGAGIGAVGGLVMVGWFIYQSVTKFFTLCPYCMVVWSMTLICAAILLPAAVKLLTGAGSGGPAQVLLTHSWAVIVMAHLVVFLVLLFALRNQIGALL